MRSSFEFNFIRFNKNVTHSFHSWTETAIWTFNFFLKASWLVTINVSLFRGSILQRPNWYKYCIMETVRPLLPLTVEKKMRLGILDLCFYTNYECF